MTLKGQMALAIVRAILANPKKFSLGLGQAACRFDDYWCGRGHYEYMPGRAYWSMEGAAERFPDDCRPWSALKELLPEDLAEKLCTGDGHGG